MQPVLVATCGNSSAGDDSFGPRVGRLLRASPHAGIGVVDLDIKPAALFDHLPGPDCLVLVDAVRMPGGGGGQLVQIDLRDGELPALLNDDAMSSHGLGLAHQLTLARQLDLLPEAVWLVGAVIDRVDQAAEPSGWMDEVVELAHRQVLSIAQGSASRSTQV